MTRQRFWNRSRNYRRELLLQQLEERIVLDAAVTAAQDNPNDQPGSQPEGAQTADQAAAGDAVTDAGQAAGGDTGLAPQLPDSFAQVLGPDLNVVLVANDLADIKAISDAAAPDAKVILFDAQHDNLATVTTMLQDVTTITGQKIDNLAIISHGTQGVLSFGIEQLQVLSLADQQDSFTQWTQILSDDAQIQFYACSLAGDPYGQALVDQIGLYTSADVFASIDVTGGSDQDWDLEYSSNPDVSMHQVFTAEGLAAVQAELAATLVKDIYPGTSSSIVGSPYFTALGNKLIFTANVNTLGYEPWVSDGTADGTINLANINASTASSSPANYTVVGDTVFFTASDGTTTGKHGVELYKTDGTAGGTVMVKDIRTGTASSSPTNLFAFNDLLYFTATDATNGTELWSSDGTEGGTQMVTNLTSGSGSSTIANFCEMGGDLYFSFGSGTASRLYVMDGTTEAISQVATVPYGVGYIKSINDTLIFTAQGPGGGYTNVGTELWKSNGTDAGTVLLADINPGGFASSPYQLTVVGNYLYFIANNTTYGSEVWVTDGIDGAAAHTHVLDVVAGTGTSSPNWLTEAGDKLFFTARTVGTGSNYYLHTHDPLAGGAPVQLTTTVCYNLRDGGTALYFGTNDASLGLGTELWKSDGTLAGTALFEDVYPGSASSSPANMTYVNGTLFFSATGAGTGAELYAVTLATPSQPPVNTLGMVTGTITEGDTGIDLGDAFSVADPDVGDTLTVNISSTAFSGFSLNGVDYTPTVQIVGTEDVVNAALLNLTGNLNPDFSGNAQITISTTDQNNQNDTDDLALAVQNVPDAPTQNADSRTVLTYMEDYTSVYTAIPLQQAGFAVTDADPNDMLTVTFTCVEGEGFASISAHGYNGTYARTDTLTGTAAELNNIMQQFSPVFGYVNLEPNFNGVAQLHMTVTDSFGLSSSGIYSMNVSAVNDSPTVQAAIPDVAVDEEAADTVFSLYPHFQDVEDTDAQLTYTVTNNTNAALFTSVNISNPTQFTLDYAPDAYGTADITIRATDTGGSWVQDTFRVTVNPVNDAPVNTVPDSITATVNTLTPITGISISDADAGSSVVQVTLGATHGTLQVGSTVAGGLTAGQISGNGTSSVVLNGTLAQIDATLADVSGLQYQSDLNYTGADTLTVSTNDLGATGSGGVLTTISTVPMTVSPWTLESESTGWATDYWRHADGVGGYDVLFAYNTATGQYYQYEGYSTSAYGTDSNYWYAIGDPGIVPAGALLDGNVHALKADGSLTFQFDNAQHREYYSSNLLGQFYYDFDHGVADGHWYQKVGAGVTDWAQAAEVAQVWFQYGPDPSNWNLGNGFEYEYSTMYGTSYWRHPDGLGGYDVLFAFAQGSGQWYQHEGTSPTPYGMDGAHWYTLGAAGADYGLLDANTHQLEAGLSYSYDGMQHRAYVTSTLLGQFYYDFDHNAGDGLWYQKVGPGATDWAQAGETEQVWFQYGPNPNSWNLGDGFAYEYSPGYGTSYWRHPDGLGAYDVMFAYGQSLGQWYQYEGTSTSPYGVDSAQWYTLGAAGANYGLLDGNAHQVAPGLTFSFDGIQHRANWTSDLLGQFYYDYDHAVGDGLWYQYQSGSATWLSSTETEQVWFQYGPDPNHWTLGSGYEYEYSAYYSTSYWRDPIGGPTYNVLYAYNVNTGQWYEQTTPTTSVYGDGPSWVTIASQPTVIG